MRKIPILFILLLVVLVVFYYVPRPVLSGETPDSGERVDLPDGGDVTVPPPEDDDNGDDTGDGEEPPDEEPEPPVEYWEVPVETDEVVYVVDRTGSMAWTFGQTVTDLEGNTVYGATKMQATNIELKRSIMNLSENIKFNVAYYAHRWGSAALWRGGHYCGSYNPSGYANSSPYPIYPVYYAPGPVPASHIDPPGSEPDTVVWQPDLVAATTQAKAQVFAWIDAKGTPNGCTCISDGMIDGGLKFNCKTIFLLTDGIPNTFRHTIYYSDPQCGGYDVAYVDNRTKTEIKNANTHNATVHTFYIRYGNATVDQRARILMQQIAAQNGPGTFTEIGS